MITSARAYRLVRTALKNGVLVRPTECPRCSAPDARGSDGRSTIHAHHHRGYDHPLDVEWLCAKCHRADTPLASGSRNARAKLTEADAMMVLRSPESCRKIAKRLGVAATTIQRVRNRTQWAQLAASGD